VSARVSVASGVAHPVWRLRFAAGESGSCLDTRCDLLEGTCLPNDGVCQGPPREGLQCSWCRANDETFETCGSEPACSCVGGGCTASTGDQASCTQQATAAGGAVFKCCGGSSCVFDFSGSEGACATCGTGSMCDVTVTGDGGAAVDCRLARSCTVHMQGASECRVACGPDCVVDSSCEVACPDGPSRNCTGGGIGCGDRCAPAATRRRRRWIVSAGPR